MMLETTEQRAARVRDMQDNTQTLFTMLIEGKIEVEQARVGRDLLQLAADLVDLADGLARRSQTR